jgi:hypothetical protein
VDLVHALAPRKEVVGMAKHRRKEKTPVSYSTVIVGVAAAAGVILVVRRVWRAR